MSNFAFVSAVLLAAVVTYLVHSTILLGSAWLLDFNRRLGRGVVAAQVWKCAAVLGIFTAAAQMTLINVYPKIGGPWRIELGRSADLPAISDQRDAQIRSDFNLDSASGSTTSQPRQAAHPLESVDKFLGNSTTSLSPPVVLAEVSSDGQPRQQRRPVASWIGPLAIRISVLSVTICFVGGVIVMGYQLARLHSRFRDSEEASGQLRNVLDELLVEAARGRRVKLLVNDECWEPIAFGFLRWTIVLPRNVVSDLSPSEVRGLLAHELAHLVRRDYWWLWFGNLLSWAAPFQPLNFIARRRWQDAAEHLCDDWALQRGIESTALARCLVRIAEHRCGAHLATAVGAVGESRSNLVWRVKRLVDVDARPAHCKQWPRQVGTASLAVATACLLILFAPAPAAQSSRLLAADAVEIEPPDQDQPRNQEWRLLDAELTELECRLDVLKDLTDGLVADETLIEMIDGLHQSAERLSTQRDELRRLISSP